KRRREVSDIGAVDRTGNGEFGDATSTAADKESVGGRVEGDRRSTVRKIVAVHAHRRNTECSDIGEIGELQRRRRKRAQRNARRGCTKGETDSERSSGRGPEHRHKPRLTTAKLMPSAEPSSLPQSTLEADFSRGKLEDFFLPRP